MPKKSPSKQIKDILKLSQEAFYAVPVSLFYDIDYSKELASLSWSEISRKAKTRRKLYEKELAEINKWHAKMDQFRPKLKELPKFEKEAARAMTGRSDWPKQKQAVIDSLKQQGRSDAEIQTFLHRVDHPWIYEKLGGLVNANSDIVRKTRLNLLMLLMAARLAEAVASFNLQIKQGAPFVVREIAGWCDVSETKISAGESGIHAALAGNKIADIPGLCTELKTGAEKILEEGTARAAFLYREIAGSKGPAEMDAMDLSRRVSDVLRASLRSLAMVYVLDTASGETGNLLFKRWVRYAAKLPYDVPQTIPYTYSVTQIKEQPLAEGQYLALRGMVKDVVIIKKGRIYTSLVDVVDVSGNKVTAVLRFMKADSGGMVPGTAVSINGTYYGDVIGRCLKQVPKKYADKVREFNPAGINIEQLNYGELSKVSWKAWVTKELYHVYEAVPNGLELSWSWQPGENGAGNQLRYNIWTRR